AANRPGVLATLALLISQAEGNILRSVNNTLPNGGFYLRLVIGNLSSRTRSTLRKAFEETGIELETLEIAGA
ncbi:MAG: hypothetical protein ACYCXH_09125, partial [Bellilinea sp.]